MRPALRHEAAAWIITAVLLTLALTSGLLPALLAGLLTFELVHTVAERLPVGRAGAGKIVAVGILAVVVVVMLTGLVVALLALVQGGELATLLQKMADILQESRDRLPQWLLASIPPDADEIKGSVVQWLHEHAAELRHIGGEVGRVVVHIVIGTVIGAMVALREARGPSHGGPLAAALGERAMRVGEAFRRVVFAQVRIAALNAALTALYLLVALPLAGVHLPFAKTLVAVTFVSGLIPVAGNLISNMVIVVMSLSVSLQTALASLVFLVVVHKLEYFLNARIVGAGIRASAWELLVAMLVMESVFGIPGLVAAPIYYAYLKDELAARGLVGPPSGSGQSTAK